MQARSIVQIASHECARKLIGSLTPKNIANPIVFQSLLHTASSLLISVVREKIDETIITMHQMAPPNMAPRVVQLAPMIKNEIPRLGVAASKFISKDLVSLGCAIDTALEFGERVQDIIRMQITVDAMPQAASA